MKIYKKARLRIFLMSSIIFISVSLKSQEELVNSKNWGIELQSYGVHTFAEFNFNLQYHHNKNTFYAGAGFSKYFHNKPLEPVIQIGFRRYPGYNFQPFKFYYQTFIYYSTRHFRDIEIISGRFVTANFGAGIAYNYTKSLSVGLNTSVGWGPNFITKSGTITLIPLQFCISYKI